MIDTVIGDLVFRTVCERHGFTAFVGKNVAFALSEYECPRCVAETDAAAEERRMRVQLSYWGTVTGHHPECLCSAVCFQDDDPEPPFYATFTSPGFCDHDAGKLCRSDACRHPECVEDHQNPPF